MTTPEIVEVGLDLPVGQAFVVHHLIPGRVLQRADVGTLCPNEIEHIGRQVGRFLDELHAIDLALVPDVPVLTPSDFASQLKAEVEDRLSAHVGPQQLDTLF